MKIDDGTFLKIRSLCKYYHMSNDRDSDIGWEHACHCKENIDSGDSWITCSLDNCKIFKNEENKELK